MFRLHAILFVPLMLLSIATSGYANTILSATLTNSQENPPTTPTLTTGPPRPASFGTATFNLNDAMTAMTFSATIFNIDFTGSQTADVNDNLTAAHIHAAPAVTPTTNAPVVWGFFGNPFNDNNPNDVVFTPFTTGVGGTISGKWDAPEGNATTLAAQLPNILSGKSYINFHTVQFGGGEIRGALTVVPEPSTILLLGVGTLSLALGRWRSQAGTSRDSRAG
jgi:CHRD domain/PEP-CTERM motif